MRTGDGDGMEMASLGLRRSGSGGGMLGNCTSKLWQTSRGGCF